MAEASLMPKKAPSGVDYRGEGLGAFMQIALILFVLSGAMTGILFAYKGILTKQLDEQKKVLADLQNQFEPTLIKKLEDLAASIDNAKALLAKHVYVSPIFDFLEKNSLPDVGFSSFTYASDKKTLQMAGDSPSYTEVAAQIKVFQNQPEISLVTFSNTALQETGAVKFTVNLSFK